MLAVTVAAILVVGSMVAVMSVVDNADAKRKRSVIGIGGGNGGDGGNGRGGDGGNGGGNGGRGGDGGGNGGNGNGDGGNGNCALPGPNSSPRPQANKSSKS